MIEGYWILQGNDVVLRRFRNNVDYSTLEGGLKNLHAFVSRGSEFGSLEFGHNKLVYFAVGEVVVCFLVSSYFAAASRIIEYIFRRTRRVKFVSSGDVVGEIERIIGTLLSFDMIDFHGILLDIRGLDVFKKLQAKYSRDDNVQVKLFVGLSEVAIDVSRLEFPPDFYFSRGLFDYAFFAGLKYDPSDFFGIATSGILALRTMNVFDVPVSFIKFINENVAWSDEKVSGVVALFLDLESTHRELLAQFSGLIRKFFEYFYGDFRKMSLFVSEYLEYFPEYIERLKAPFRNSPFFSAYLRYMDMLGKLASILYGSLDRDAALRWLRKLESSVFVLVDSVNDLTRDNLLSPTFNVGFLYDLVVDSVLYIWLLDNMYLLDVHRICLVDCMTRVLELLKKLRVVFDVLPIPLIVFLSFLQALLSLIKKMHYGDIPIDPEFFVAIDSFSRMLSSLCETKPFIFSYPRKLINTISDLVYLYWLSGSVVPDFDRLVNHLFIGLDRLLKIRFLNNEAIIDKHDFLNNIHTILNIFRTITILASIFLNKRDTAEIVERYIKLLIDSTRFMLTHMIPGIEHLLDGLEILIQIRPNIDHELLEEYLNLMSTLLDLRKYLGLCDPKQSAKILERIKKYRQSSANTNNSTKYTRNTSNTVFTRIHG